jgi:hypothetical protein
VQCRAGIAPCQWGKKKLLQEDGLTTVVTKLWFWYYKLAQRQSTISLGQSRTYLGSKRTISIHTLHVYLQNPVNKCYN